MRSKGGVTGGEGAKRTGLYIISISGLFNMCFLFLKPVKCALLHIHSSVTATLFSVSAKHKFK